MQVPSWVHRVYKASGGLGRPIAARRGWGMDGEVRLELSEDGADAERLDELTGFLRRELLQLDVADVAALPAGEPPPGSRAFDVLAIGALLVTLGNSAEGLRSVVDAVRSWLGRGGDSRRTVKLEIGGDVLELTEASKADQQRLIDMFVSRHAAADST